MLLLLFCGIGDVFARVLPIGVEAVLLVRAVVTTTGVAVVVVMVAPCCVAIGVDCAADDGFASDAAFVNGGTTTFPLRLRLAVVVVEREVTESFWVYAVSSAYFCLSLLSVSESNAGTSCG